MSWTRGYRYWPNSSWSSSDLCPLPSSAAPASASHGGTPSSDTPASHLDRLSPSSLLSIFYYNRYASCLWCIPGPFQSSLQSNASSVLWSLLWSKDGFILLRAKTAHACSRRPHARGRSLALPLCMSSIRRRYLWKGARGNSAPYASTPPMSQRWPTRLHGNMEVGEGPPDISWCSVLAEPIRLHAHGDWRWRWWVARGGQRWQVPRASMAIEISLTPKAVLYMEVTMHQSTDFRLCYSQFFFDHSEQDTCTWNPKVNTRTQHSAGFCLCFSLFFSTTQNRTRAHGTNQYEQQKKPKNTNDFCDRWKTIFEKTKAN